MRHLITLALAAFMLNGCVALDKYNALKLERDQYLERLGQAESEARAERERAKVLKDQLDALMAAGGDHQTLLQNLNKQNAELQAKLDELNRKYLEAVGRPPVGIALPAELDTALKELAAQYPELVEYDSARGILKFKSDVTFASGSAELTGRAKEVLTKFTQIINSPVAARYELLVAGHTDNVRVSNAATVRAGHKDNWYLSAHRAISVGEDLLKDGVSASRMGVVGYAEQRPVDSNTSAAGRAKNRRVEVLILPAKVGDTGEATPAPAPRAAKPAVDAVPAESMTK